MKYLNLSQFDSMVSLSMRHMQKVQSKSRLASASVFGEFEKRETSARLLSSIIK